MKCILDAAGKVKRVSDAEARKRVEAGTHHYTKKSVWKKGPSDA